MGNDLPCLQVAVASRRPASENPFLILHARSALVRFPGTAAATFISLTPAHPARSTHPRPTQSPKPSSRQPFGGGLVAQHGTLTGRGTESCCGFAVKTESNSERDAPSTDCGETPQPHSIEHWREAPSSWVIPALRPLSGLCGFAVKMDSDSERDAPSTDCGETPQPPGFMG